MNNNQEYKLYLKKGNYKKQLMSGSLIKIDRFTTHFKNRDDLLSKMFFGLDFDYSQYDISIESKRERIVPIKFIGSDFKGVCEIFSDGEKHLQYTNKFSLINPDILIRYFNEKIDERVQNIKDITERETKKKEYLNNKKIPVVKLLDLLNQMKKFDNKEKENPIFESLFLDVSYHIRNYCNSYYDFRDFYSNMKAEGLLVDEPVIEKDYDEEFEFDLYNVQYIIDQFVKNFDSTQNLIKEAGEEATKLFNKDKIASEGSNLGKITYKKELKEKLKEEAKAIGKNECKQQRKDTLIDEGTTIGEKIFKKEQIKSEGENLGKELYKNAQDNFTLNFIEKNEFTDHLKSYYNNKLMEAKTEEEKEEIINEYNDEISSTYDAKVGL